ncbi:hypothetical protein R3P38DRAFT_2687295 [Favolaschia claudopus]|uniref:Glycosyltransferase 61 catalytic domain-containing protein n=1 Tax=Favolaschia claudopus TaxID=2862362 RepID=A0AAW0D653_9AGAR
MGFAPPTPREILLIFLLLASLYVIFIWETHREQFLPVPFQSNSLKDSVQSAASQEQEQELQVYQTRVSWEHPKAPVPQTRIIAHVPGWSIIDHLYIFKGVVYIVSDVPSSIPNVSAIYSKGIDIELGREAELARLPDDTDIRVISTGQARRLFGKGAQFLDGVTILVNDPPQFVRHYYHWAAELFFGLWRTYSSLDPSIPASGRPTSLPPPRRMWFPRLDAFRWRDYSFMNQYILRASFPALTMEFVDDWDDRRNMGVPWVLERVVVADRSAAMMALNYQRYQRTAASAFGLGRGSASWWMVIRGNVVRFAGMEEEEAEGEAGAGAVAEGASKANAIVITYISRQEWGRRMLIQQDHEKLVRELRKLERVYGWEVNVVMAEKMTRLEQLRLAARTTIMMGVHGNGLTNLVWMKPNARSTVMEFFYPGKALSDTFSFCSFLLYAGGFAHDYEYTTRALGMTHYGFWNDVAFTSPDLPLPSYPEGFQGRFIAPCYSSLMFLVVGNSIPLDGEAVAALCIQRLTLEEEVDDG